MASTSVNLTKIKRDKGTVYQIDYRINRKRIREVVGPDRRTAELKRATTAQALIEGKLGLSKPIAASPLSRISPPHFLQ